MLPRLRIATLALVAVLALPALPALAYTSAGGVTYFGPYAALYASGAAANTTTTTVTAPAGSTGYTISKPWYSVTSGSTTGTGTTTSSPSTQGTSTLSSASSGSGTASLSQQDRAFLQMVNDARAQSGLGALTDNPLLDRLALQKAQDLATYNYFAHYSPRLGWPIQQEEQAGFYALYMGAENIAEAGTVSRAFIDLMNSPGHVANILDPGFTQTGIAIVPVPYGVLVEELFAGPTM